MLLAARQQHYLCAEPGSVMLLEQHPALVELTVTLSHILPTGSPALPQGRQQPQQGDYQPREVSGGIFPTVP